MKVNPKIRSTLATTVLSSLLMVPGLLVAQQIESDTHVVTQDMMDEWKTSFSIHPSYPV